MQACGGSCLLVGCTPHAAGGAAAAPTDTVSPERRLACLFPTPRSLTPASPRPNAHPTHSRAQSVESLAGAAEQLPVEIPLGREFVFHSIFACPVIREQVRPGGRAARGLSGGEGRGHSRRHSQPPSAQP